MALAQTRPLHQHFTSQRQPAVMVVSQNRSERFLIAKLLEAIGTFRLYEVQSTAQALKVAKYLSLDLIIVDDMMRPEDGYEIVDKLDAIPYLEPIPKLMLVTEQFKKEKRMHLRSKETDFIKKPIEAAIFRRRVESALKRAAHSGVNGSLFGQLIEHRLDEAKALIGIYKSLLEIDEEILCVYDARSHTIVEFNRHFTRFFGNFRFVNRILADRKLLRRFLPYQEQAHFINHYDSARWPQLFLSQEDRPTMMQIRHFTNRYTFRLFVRTITIPGKELYLIRLADKTTPTKKSDKELETRFDRLKRYLLSKEGYSEDKQLMQLLGVQTHLQAKCAPQPQKRAFDLGGELITLFKAYERLSCTLNGTPLSRAQLHLRSTIDKEAFIAMVEGLLECFVGDSATQETRIETVVEEREDQILFAMRILSEEEPAHESLFERLFKREEKFERTTQLLPKRVEWAIGKLDGQIRQSYDGHIRQFLIMIPKTEVKKGADRNF